MDCLFNDAPQRVRGRPGKYPGTQGASEFPSTHALSTRVQVPTESDVSAIYCWIKLANAPADSPNFRMKRFQSHLADGEGRSH